MSYCRFSSDDFVCDVYVYEHCHGFWAIHVACNRVVPCEPMPLSLTDENDVNAWCNRIKEVSRIVDASEREPIGLPEDGETFEEPSPGACADRLDSLKAMGYVVPQRAIDALRDEQRVIDEVSP